ncbi:40s ribosomal protein s6-like, partial [Lynx pardinus]
VSTCCQVRGIPATDQRAPKEDRANLFGVALWMPISVFPFLHSLIPLCLTSPGAQKNWQNPRTFNLSTEDDICQYVVIKPLNKGKKSRTKAPKIQCLVTPCALQHTHQCIALKKQHTKKHKEEAAEYAKLLAKRMKEAKETHQRQTAKRWMLSSESFYL